MRRESGWQRRMDSGRCYEGGRRVGHNRRLTDAAIYKRDTIPQQTTKIKQKREKRFFLSPLFIAKRDSPLRCHSINISREHRTFFDVGDAEEASGDTLQADGEAAVRGHAVSALPLCASLWPPIRPRLPSARAAPRPSAPEARAYPPPP